MGVYRRSKRICVHTEKSRDGKNKLTIKRAERIKNQKAIFAEINTALCEGDLKRLDEYCDRLKDVYLHGETEGENLHGGDNGCAFPADCRCGK